MEVSSQGLTVSRLAAVSCIIDYGIRGMPINMPSMARVVMRAQPELQMGTPISAERNSTTIWDGTAQFLPSKSDGLRRQG